MTQSKILFCALVTVLGTLASQAALAQDLVQCFESYSLLSGDHSLFSNGMAFGKIMSPEISADGSKKVYTGGTPLHFLRSVKSAYTLTIDTLKRTVSVESTVFDGRTQQALLTTSKTAGFDNSAETKPSIVTSTEEKGEVTWVLPQGKVIGEPKVAIGGETYLPKMDAKYEMGSGQFGSPIVVYYKIDCQVAQ